MIDLSHALLLNIVALAKQAGQAVMPIYHGAAVEAVAKGDGSPVTQADLLAHRILLAGLSQLTPDVPCLSEESYLDSEPERQAWPCYWLIDPVDGTKEFLAKNGDFTVNIALIKDHQPVLGVVYAPAHQLCYYAAQGLGAYKDSEVAQPLHVKAVHPAQALTVAVSRRHGQASVHALQQDFAAINLCQRGSSLKFCLIAEGQVDLYPRLAPTSEWDTAAAQCILEQAGGQVIDLTGQALRYNLKKTVENPSFIAFGDASISWLQYFG